MKRNAASFVVGLIFAFGLGLSGMTDANKVIGFLDLLSGWDPSLAFVMVGAIGVHLAFYRLIMNRKSPLFDQTFYLPTNQVIDTKLIVGAGLFGVGWGLSGYCPGPAIVSLASPNASIAVFFSALIVGMVLQRVVAGKN